MSDRKLYRFNKKIALDKAKRERLEKDIDDYRIFSEVFDASTLMAVYDMLSRGVISNVHGCIRMGKESCIHLAESGEDVFVLKIYRMATSDFRDMWQYLGSDPRFRDLNRRRRDVIYTWASREFKNLKRAQRAGCSSPIPKRCHRNLVIMECIERDGLPAPRLIDRRSEDPEGELESIFENYRTLYREAELVHGDLSAYNILLSDEGPVFIDFSTGTVKENPTSTNLLFRDIENVISHYRKQGVEGDVQSVAERITGKKGIAPDESIAI